VVILRNTRDLSTIGLLDGANEEDFDRAVQLLARVLRCDVSLLSVIDEARDRQAFKAETGLAKPWSDLRETPLSHSFCRTVVAEASMIRVTDARLDPRFKDNPAVQELGVIGYLGMPVETAPGEPVGALCAISSTPRDWTEPDAETLRTLAATVSAQIQLRLALRDQRQISANLEVTTQRFTDLAANVPGAIFRYVLHPDGRDEVEYMSPGCMDIWEVGPQDIAGNPALLWNIIVPEDVQGMQASIMRSAQQLVEWKHRWRVITRSGKQKWLQGYGQPKRLGDGSIIWNSLILDVTVEVQAQNKLRENDRLLAESQKQEIIGRLAGGVAHDFNNILAIILGNAEIMLSGTAAEPAESYLSDIVQAAQRGRDLTRSLLSFARRSELKPEVMEVNQTIEELQTLLRRALPENISLKVTRMVGLWPVRADRGALESALLNLVLNARDAMQKGGTLTIETANVDISEDYIAERHEDIPPGRYVMLAVTDTGSGMTPDVLDRAFEPFFTTKETDKGSGLGLPMVQGFAKQSNGMVRIYTELGHGTSVKMYLRAVEAPSSLPETKPEPAPTVAVGRVLLVEDNEAVRRTVRWTLEGAGYTVIEAASGDAAMDMMDDVCSGFDLILTDVVMPGRLQGPELVHRIRDRRPDVPVIFMSGYPHEANVHGNGIRDTDISLMKPFARSDLLAALSGALIRAGNRQT
jgi:signal transduction histidine kinase/ActR/RegA family two-component response regulator